LLPFIIHHPDMTDDIKSKLIDGLNTDLANEYQAVVMYTTYAAMATGIHRPLLKAFFESEIPEELEHAQYLADKITALGGEPTTQPARLELKRDTASMLRQVLDAERATIKRYIERRRQAEEIEEYGLAADLDGIISDETKHAEETEKLLRGLGEP
jgi:bacterioferritin